MSDVVLGPNDGYAELLRRANAEDVRAKGMNVDQIAAERTHRIDEKAAHLAAKGLRQIRKAMLTTHAKDTVREAALLGEPGEFVRWGDDGERHFTARRDMEARDIDHETFRAADSTTNEKVNDRRLHVRAFRSLFLLCVE